MAQDPTAVRCLGRILHSQVQCSFHGTTMLSEGAGIQVWGSRAKTQGVCPLRARSQVMK